MYRRTFDANAQDSLARISRWVHAGATVLELGPAAGYFTRHLRDWGCTVDVIEIDPQAAEEVSGAARTVIVGDLASATTWERLAGQRYDTIVCADVLEHLVDGRALLERLRAVLAPGGQLLLSVPNVAHSAVIAGLLDEHFDYGHEGILDPTHVRFYTRRSLAALLDEAGFVVDEWDGVVVEAYATEFRTRVERFRPEIAELLGSRPNALVYQWLARARIADGSLSANVPVLQGAEHVPLRVLTAASPEALSLDHARVLALEPGAPATELEILAADARGVWRIMLSDRPGVLDLPVLELCAGDRVVWTLADPDGQYRSSGEVIRLDATRFALLAADAWIEPVIDRDVAPAIDRLRIAAGWPTPLLHSEAFALFEGLAEALGGARRRATLEIDHLKGLVGERDALIDEVQARARADVDLLKAQLAERDALLDARSAALSDAENGLREGRAEIARLESALVAQEHIIAHRHSLSWWLQLPWLLLRSRWRRLTARFVP